MNHLLLYRVVYIDIEETNFEMVAISFFDLHVPFPNFYLCIITLCLIFPNSSPLPLDSNSLAGKSPRDTKILRLNSGSHSAIPCLAL